MIGVLSPFIGGAYYGGLLAGIARAAAVAGDRVIAVQTLDAGSYMADGHVAADFMPPIAWDHVGGLIVIVDAVNTKHLELARAAGKPIVVIGHRFPDFSCPTVMAENGTGVREAVTHLIRHGHRRIAFVGYTVATDIEERYKAYAAALREHGIEPDPALYYRTADSMESGGVDAARRMIAAGLPSTAVVTGTDLNAMGLMRTLAGHGLHLPDDQAIVGFDDVDAAAYLTPSLASVKQLVGNMGGTAVDLLARQLRGEPVEFGEQRVVTAFVPRASCGCSDAGDVSDAADPVASATPVGRLTARLAALLPPVGARRPDDADALADGVEAIARAIDAVAAGAPPGPLPERPLLRLYYIQPQPASLTTITNAAQAYADATVPPDGSDPGTIHRVSAQVREVTLQLAHIQGRWSYRDNTDFRAAVSSQYEVSMELLHSHENDPRALRWLARTPARGGALGLWTPAAVSVDSGAKLDIAGVYVRDQAGPEPGAASTIEAFPPAELFALPETPEDVVFVVPAKGNANDWGLLAIVGPLETRVPNGRETVNQCAALLTVALDLRSQEERLRRAALYDALTGLPNRALFLERLSRSLRRSRRNDAYRFAVLFLDLDGFKRVNDSLGHSAGDQLLMEVANRITGTLREIDTAARFGGDEFVVLLEDIGESSYAGVVAERLRVVLGAPLLLEGTVIDVRASTGIAVGDASYDSAEDVLREADAAMYRVKLQRR